MTRAVTLTVVTANIGRGVTREVARANLHRIRTELPGALIGFQEIDEADAPDEHTRLVRRFPAPSQELHDDLASADEGTFTFAGFNQATPIGVPAEWAIVGQSVKQTCPGRAMVTPHRVVVAARCRPVLEPDFPPVVFLNGHYPRGAPDLWSECQESWKERVDELHEQGLTVITTRDTNKHGRMPKLHPAERQLLAPNIDRISVIPAKQSSAKLVTVRVLSRRIVNLTIDGHDARAVKMRLKAPNS
jgi:hypothetical protein